MLVGMCFEVKNGVHYKYATSDHGTRK